MHSSRFALSLSEPCSKAISHSWASEVARAGNSSTNQYVAPTEPSQGIGSGNSGMEYSEQAEGLLPTQPPAERSMERPNLCQGQEPSGNSADSLRSRMEPISVGPTEAHEGRERQRSSSPRNRILQRGHSISEHANDSVVACPPLS